MNHPVHTQREVERERGRERESTKGLICFDCLNLFSVYVELDLCTFSPVLLTIQVLIFLDTEEKERIKEKKERNKELTKERKN